MALPLIIRSVLPPEIQLTPSIFPESPAILEENHVVVIVGAGFHGLCVAHTLPRINPSLSLLVVDDKDNLVGVWSKQQLYRGLRANNFQGYYEFSDFPILEAGLEDLGIGPCSVLSGEAICAYLHKYAQHCDLMRRIQFRTRVLDATNHTDQAERAWTMTVARASSTTDFDSDSKARSLALS